MDDKQLLTDTFGLAMENEKYQFFIFFVSLANWLNSGKVFTEKQRKALMNISDWIEKQADLEDCPDYGFEFWKD